MVATRPPRSLTDEQASALDASGVSVALSAGAGCGKTFVLTERFLAAIDPSAEDRAELHEVVAITFTEKAAREMRDRVRRACHERLLHATDDAGAAYWRQTLRRLDAARIGTIHAFCGALLRSHAVEARLDPRFAVLDDAQAATLRHETIDDVLRRQLVAHDSDVVDLLTRFELRRVKEMLADWLGLASAEQLSAWADRDPAEVAESWRHILETEVIPQTMAEIALLPAVSDVLAALRDGAPSHPKLVERRQVLEAVLPRLASSPTPLADLSDVLANAGLTGTAGAKPWSNPASHAQFREAAVKLRKACERARDRLQFDPERAVEGAEITRQMLRVAAGVAAEYVARKSALASLDFDDLLRQAHALLVDPAHASLRKRVAAGIRLLLVDEFQDTDPVQVGVIEALCSDRLTRGKLFFVGDAKQSIYRFRGADPGVFRDLRQRIPAQGRLPLTRNFRSQPAILDFVNALFRDDLEEAYEPLVAHRMQVSPTPAVELMWALDETVDKESAEAARRREARWIARRVRELIDSRVPLVWDREAPAEAPRARPAEQGDVAILFRALSDVELYEQALREAGLDYYLVGGHAFYQQQEVFDLLNLLRAVHSGIDDVSLVGALRSPFFSLADETLYWLAQHPQGLWAGLAEAERRKELSADQRRQAMFAERTLHTLREAKDRVPVAILIRQALEFTGYDALLLAEFLGERKLANLHKLIEQARAFDGRGGFGLAEFLVQLSEFVARQPKEALAATHPESANVVVLMTIHQAKGLEFPIVVIPDLNRKVQSAGSGVGVHPRLGGVLRLDEETRNQAGCTGYELYQQLHQAEEAGERLRLLYVATTRAADFLLLSAGLSKADASDNPWLELLDKRFDRRTGAMLAPLPEGATAPQIRVTTVEPPAPTARRRGARRPDLAKLADAIADSAGASAKLPATVRPVPVDEASRARFSFSQLSGELETASPDEPSIDDEPIDRPWPGDARALGTLVHAVLADRRLAPENVTNLLERYAARHLPRGGDKSEAASRQVIVACASELLARHLTSARAEEIAAASRVYRELDFLLAWPPRFGNPGAAGSRHSGGVTTSLVYFEGVIDCLYRDAHDRWQLVDYKTNRVTAGQVAQAAGKYELQLGLYALAIEAIWGELPAALTLHFMAPGSEHQWTWSAEQRDAAIARIDRALVERQSKASATEHV